MTKHIRTNKIPRACLHVANTSLTPHPKMTLKGHFPQKKRCGQVAELPTPPPHAIAGTLEDVYGLTRITAAKSMPANAY